MFKNVLQKRLLQVPVAASLGWELAKLKVYPVIKYQGWKVTTLGMCYLESASSSVSYVFSEVAGIGSIQSQGRGFIFGSWREHGSACAR